MLLLLWKSTIGVLQFLHLLTYLYTSYTYIPDAETCCAASFGHLWQNQAVVTHLKETWGWRLPNSKTEPLANHVILLADQYACQDVRFTCRHCDRFAKHASLTGNGVTTHRDGMKAMRWLVGDRNRVCFFRGNPGLVPQLSFETTYRVTCAGNLQNSMFFCFMLYEQAGEWCFWLELYICE